MMRPSAVAVREPAWTMFAVQVSVPVSRVTARVKLIFISSVVNTFPAGMTELTAQPSAVSRSVAANPPCAMRSPFSNSGVGSAVTTTRPSSTSTMRMFSSRAIGDDSSSPATSLRMYSRPLMVRRARVSVRRQFQGLLFRLGQQMVAIHDDAIGGIEETELPRLGRAVGDLRRSDGLQHVLHEGKRIGIRCLLHRRRDHAADQLFT